MTRRIRKYINFNRRYLVHFTITDNVVKGSYFFLIALHKKKTENKLQPTFLIFRNSFRTFHGKITEEIPEIT